MNSRMLVQRQSLTSRTCLRFLSAATILGATATQASALLFTSQLVNSRAEEVDALNGVVVGFESQTSSALPADEYGKAIVISESSPFHH